MSTPVLPPHNIRGVNEIPSWQLRALASQQVTQIIERHATGVDYSVRIGAAPMAGDLTDARVVWDCTVTFGATDDTCSGGGAFVRAAREQERVAHEWAEFGRGE